MNCKLYQRLMLNIVCVLLFATGASVAVAREQGNGPKTVSGQIVDAGTKAPLVGVSVVVEGTTRGVVSDEAGHYAIEADGEESVLNFSYLGYVAQSIAVAGRTEINVALREDQESIDEVVVIGYGKTTKKEVTGSVASLKSNDFNTGSFTNAAGLFQGKVAGLSVVNPNGGDPNASYEILLRGANTLSAGQGPLLIIDGVVGADIRNINFQEVESIDVLKDGSAAAIYGTRGTNGVIIITTKRAHSGETHVEYDGQFTVQTVARRAEPLTAKEFEWVVNNYRPSSAGSLYGAETDWFDEVTRTPISHKHSLAVSGGSEKFSHRTVVNVEQNQGLQRKNDAEKYLFKTNIHQKAFEGWLDLDYNAYFSKRVYSPADYSVFEQAFYHNPTEPVYDPSNTTSGGYFRVDNTMAYYNPVAMLNERRQDYRADDLGGNVRATLNILPVEGLKWDNFFSYTQQGFESRDYKTRYYPGALGQDGVADIANELTRDIQWESTLNYSRQFGRHSLQAVLGYTWQRGYYESSSMENKGFDTDDWGTDNIGSGSALPDGQATMSSYKESNTYIALFGRVMYNYDERYLLSVSLRRDGSSRFGADNKWGWFPAVSLGWRISQEEFLRDVDWINELKLRAGYGVTGNQDFSNYKSLLLMSTSGRFYYNGKWINTYAPSSNANPNLGWEKKAEWNVGVDFSVLDNRLSLTLDYYQRRTTDLLYTYQVPTPPYVYNELFTNVGEIKNSGIEITLSGTPVRTKNLVWNSTFIFSRNTNKLVKFTNEEFTDGEYKVGWLNSPVAAYCQRLVEGESLGTFYGPRYLGVDEEGNDIYANSIAGNVPESAWEKIGCAYPNFTLAWSNMFRIRKNLDVSFTLRASIGGDILNTYALYYDNLSEFGLKNVSSSWLDSRYTGGVKYSSKYIEDATFLKLDNLSIGYTFNFKSKYIRSMRLSLTGQNLLCITGYKGVDPEVSLSGITPGIENISYYPSTTSFTFGVNLNF